MLLLAFVLSRIGAFVAALPNNIIERLAGRFPKGLGNGGIIISSEVL